MTHSEVWSVLKDFTKDDPAGKQVDTNLLGDVTGKRCDGKVVGYIPYYLNAEAEHYGFRIVGASVQDGTYTLDKL